MSSLEPLISPAAKSRIPIRMNEFPLIYPSEIEYRPGRIQSLTPEHELLLKQCWATLLNYWGYNEKLSESDIHNQNSFVVSEIVAEAAKTVPSEKEESKKKVSLFSRKSTSQLPKPISNTRIKELEAGANGKYVECAEPMEETKHTYLNVFKQSYTNYVSGLDDRLSVSSFVTAKSSLAETTLINVKSLKTGLEMASVTSASTANSSSGFRRKFPQYDPLDLHYSFFRVVKNDLLDNFVLRFIRASKCNYGDAMAMLTKTLNWRRNECPVEEWLAEGDAPSYVLGKNKGFVKNFTVSKSFVRGHDRNKNPLFVFQSSKHFASDTTPEETDRFALLIVEWCRLYLRDINESVDTCSLLFDLSGFTMKNADNAPVKFLTSMFESHYPESLGIVLVHNAPWIFSTVWSVIKNWLDPVVASKIHFTKGYDELKQYIEPHHIPEYLGGENKEDLSYSTPTEKDTKPMKSRDGEFYRLCVQRDELFLRFIDATISWVNCTNPKVSSQYLKEKIRIGYELSNNYIALDPYLRNPGFLDRKGFLEVKN